MNQTPSSGVPEFGGLDRPANTGGSSDGLAVRWANLVVWTLVALLATALGVILIPLHLPGGFLVPIAPLIGVAANFLLPKLLLAGTGWRGTRFVPAVIWLLVALVGSTPSSDGDLLISGSSHSSVVGLAYLGLGALGAVLGIIFAASPMRRPRRGD